MAYKRGEIYLCRFTGEGSEPQGKRPCIIVSNNQNNKFSSTVNVEMCIRDRLYISCFFGDIKPRFFSAQKKWGFENLVFPKIGYNILYLWSTWC